MGSSSSSQSNKKHTKKVQYLTWVPPNMEPQYIAPYDVDDIAESKNNKSSLSKYEQLLISGYIREIQVLLKKNIIPDSIYSLCLTFYHPSTMNILWKLNKKDENLRQFGVLDVDNNKSSIINFKRFDEYDETHWLDPLCYIPNISYSLPINMINNDHKLDGIFSVQKTIITDYLYQTSKNQVYESYPCLILYEPYNGDTTAKCEYKSNKSINHEPAQFLYCNNKNTVIYEWDGLFYQLNLTDVETENDLSNFVSLKQNEQRYKLNTRWRTKGDYEYLNMTYLENKESIFAIRCKSVSSSNCTGYSMGNPQQTKCGIFNINNKNWMDIKPYRYIKKPNDDGFRCLTYYDKIYDNIYLYDFDMFYASKYDLNRNEWKTISKDKKLRFYLKTLWAKDNILYGLSRSTNNESIKTKFQLNSLDLRDNKREWIMNSIKFEGIENDKKVYYSLFV